MHNAPPPLNALRAFEAAARQLSLTKAAFELNVTPGALSHQIRGLEDHLGLKLFDRGVRSIALTGVDRIAVGALIAGIASWILCPVIAALVAVSLGIGARRQIRRTGESGGGMAMAGLILGSIQLVAVGLVILVWLGGALVLGLVGVSTRH